MKSEHVWRLTVQNSCHVWSSWQSWQPHQTILLSSPTFSCLSFFTFFLLEICHVISNHLISHLPCWGRANFPLQCCELPLLGKFCCALVSSEIMVGLRLQVRGSFFSLFICGLNLFHVNFNYHKRCEVQHLWLRFWVGPWFRDGRYRGVIRQTSWWRPFSWC